MSTSEFPDFKATPSQNTTKTLAPILENIFAFEPNREAMGSCSYLIVEKEGNILVDCPPKDKETENIIHQMGGVRWLVFTHRGAIAPQITHFQKAFDTKIVIQEQEAYLLPNFEVIPFSEELHLTPLVRLIWTPGHSPGSSCLYYNNYDGVIFTGRHLLPTSQGSLMPLRTGKTFHWHRQLQSVQLLQKLFTEQNLHYAIPGANLGFLGSQKFIQMPLSKLSELDFASLGNKEIFF